MSASSSTVEFHDLGPAESEGLPLLLLHGLGGTRDYWGDLLTELARDRRCIAWSLPGYAGSPALSDTTFTGLADAAADLLDLCGIDKAVVLGHSLGGMVAQELWARHPDRIAALTLVGTAPSFGGGSKSFIDSFLASRLAPIEAGHTPAEMADETINGLIGEPISDSTRDHLRKIMGSIEPGPYADTVRCLTTFDQRSALSTITVPTLLISGNQDRTAPSKVMASMAAEIDGSTHLDIDGAGHLIDQERPEAFRAAVKGFLDGLSSSGS